MTTIKHLAIWTRNLESLRDFYETYFEAEAGAYYVNADRAFESCWLSRLAPESGSTV